MLEKELQLEKNWFFLLNGSESTLLDNFLWLCSYKWTWVPFYFCFVVVFIYQKNWKEFLPILLVSAFVILLCDQVSSGFFKPCFHRLRPTHHPDFMNEVDLVLGYRGGKYGFISGHATNAFGFAVWTALIFRNKLFTVMMLSFAALTAYSRVYLGVHFISDIVVGALVGALIGWLVYQLYRCVREGLLKKNKNRLQKSIYSDKQAYCLCGVYAFLLIILLFVSSQNVMAVA